MALTDEHIGYFQRVHCVYPGTTRAIESAATAPLLERIAELEQQLAEARKQMEAQKDEWLSWEATRKALEQDAERYRGLRLSCLQGYPSSEGSEDKDAYLVITGYKNLYPMTDEQKDTAVDAVLKKDET